MICKINLLAEQESRVQIVHLNGRASEGINQRHLNRRQRVVASEVSADTSAYPVEGFGGIGATIQCVSRQQLRPRGPMRPAIGGLFKAIEA
jgi:hypothetical protein